MFLYLDANIRVERIRVRELTRLGAADPEFPAWAALADPAASHRSIDLASATASGPAG